MTRFPHFFAFGVLLALPLFASAQVPSSGGIQFFEKNIGPILVKQCFQCHSTTSKKKLRGGLALDSSAGLRKGGKSGNVIVPGMTAQSLIIKAL